jgi:DNA-binding beta-propeller fold protein YncE
MLQLAAEPGNTLLAAAVSVRSARVAVSAQNAAHIGPHSESTDKLGTLQLSTGQIHLIANLPFTARHVIVHPAGDRLIIADHTASKVWVYDVRTEQVVGVASVSYGANQLALTPRGQFILVVSYYTGELTVLQTNDLSVRQVIKVGTTAAALAFDPIGYNIFVSDNGGHSGVMLQT